MRRSIIAATFTLSVLVFPFGTGISKGTSRQVTVREEIPSVLFIMLDEASLWSMVRPDGTINTNRFPGFASLADNSTWYRDTLTTAQWTWFAAPALLSGKEATFAKKPIYTDWRRNLFTALKGSVEMDVQEPVTSLCPRSVCARPMKSSKTMGPSGHVMTIYDTVDRAAASTQPTLHFVHAVVPHRPWLLTPEMRLSANRMADPRPKTIVDRKRDVYEAHLRQYIAVDTVIGDVVRTMKASVNWDNTMIVLTADHGLTFRPGTELRTKIDSRKTSAMDEVFRTPLFIKYPGQTSGAVSDCAASSMDIVPTILSVLGANPGWDFDGVDLTRECPQDRARPVHWPEGQTVLRTHFSEVLRSVAYYDKWVDSEGTVDDIARVGLSGSLVGTTVPTSAKTDKRVEWKLHRPRDFQTIGEGRFAPAPGRATGRFRTVSPIDTRTEGLIVMDGTVMGVVAELARQRPTNDWQFFSSCLMTSALRPGKHTVELWTAEWKDGQPMLRRVGPPSQ